MQATYATSITSHHQGELTRNVSSGSSYRCSFFDLRLPASSAFLLLVQLLPLKIKVKVEVNADDDNDEDVGSEMMLAIVMKKKK